VFLNRRSFRVAVAAVTLLAISLAACSPASNARADRDAHQSQSVLLAAKSQGLTAAESVSAQTELRNRLQTLANEAVRSGLVGVSLAVHHPREGMILVTAGNSDVERGTSVTSADVARIASSSKVFIGTLVLQLVDEGRITVDDPIARYVSSEHAEHIANARVATIAQLLTHSSGIADYYNGGYFGYDVPDKMDFTIDEALRYAWDVRAEFQPGQRYGYSNTNTLLLGAMIERVTGRGVAQVLRERILAPLGLRNIYTEVFEPVPVRIVRGYSFEGRRIVDVAADKIAGGGLPDGGLVSSPEAMVQFVRGLLADKRLLSARSLEAMTTVHVRDRAEDIAIGYHLFVESTRQGMRYTHDGALSGYLSFMAHYPASDTTFAAWTNSRGDDQEQAWESFIDDVSRSILR